MTGKLSDNTVQKMQICLPQRLALSIEGIHCLFKGR